MEIIKEIKVVIVNLIETVATKNRDMSNIIINLNNSNHIINHKGDIITIINIILIDKETIIQSSKDISNNNHHNNNLLITINNNNKIKMYFVIYKYF